MNFGGPVGECKLEDFAVDKKVLTKLWAVSEEATEFSWQLKNNGGRRKSVLGGAP